MLTARGKAMHPAAARLLANYVLSMEGNKVYNDEPGGVAMHDQSRLPREYQPPKAGIIARKDEIFRLLYLK
ncbi:MAG: hypothetical protein FJY55_15670 [Betaproteobacteria bacterium]|nr:hypothetical protein [Betaproteobacteria bacterium]